MALDSVFAIAPPLVGERNKDTLIVNEGEIESEEIKVNGNSEPEDVDLEEGEILDDSEQETFEAPAAGASGEHIQKKEVTGCESKLELEQLEPYVGETKDNSNKNKKRKKKKTKLVNDIDPLELEAIIKSKSKKQKKKHSYYVDHDRVTDSDPWFERSLSPNCSPTYYRSVRDYRHEYDDQYRGTYGSPGPYDSACNSPSYIRSPSPFSDYSCNEESDDHNERVSKSHHNISHNQRKSVKRHLVTERGRRKRKLNGFRGGPENKKSRKVKKVKRENWKQLCKFYMEGKCHKGADCPYLHDVTPPKKKELCKFYIHGFCAKGEKCLYMHKDFPCKFFHTGAKCYAENNCIFSHDPLTDETKKILDKYLEGTRADEDDKDDAGGDVMRGSERGRSPLKKRPSLLGSPPRHVKEQAESWRKEVQQQQLQHRLKNQMLHQQRQQFSNGGILSPPRNSRERLNFYTDTLQSPKKSSRVMQATSGKSTGLLKPPSSMSPRTESEEAAKFDRCISSGYQSKICSTSWFKQEDQKYSLHDLSETEREGSLLSPKHEPHDSERSLSKYVNETSKVKEQEEIKEQIKEGSPVYNTDEDTSMAPLSASPPSDTSSSQGVNNLICIPTHLPRRQKQLFLRIQQQQKEVGENGTEASEEQDSKPGEGTSEKEEEKAEGKIAEWDSSDDDDDTEDQPLTAVLKKLQQMPPPTPQLQSKEGPATNQPTIDIAKMLHAIRQQANVSSSPAVVQAFNQQPEFWQNILAGTAPVPVAMSSSALPNPAQSVMENGEKSTTGPLSKDQRIQEVQEAVLSQDLRIGQPPRDPRVQFRDPRLGAGVSTRDPRLGESITVTQSLSNMPKSSSEPLISTRSIINSTRRSSTSEKNKSVAKNAHYKLHPVSKSHPNYVTYVIAGNGDPKLFNDPRVRKHLTEVPPPPHLQVSSPTQASLLGNFQESFHNFVSQELKAQTEPQSSLPPLPILVNPTEVELSEPTENKPLTSKHVDPRLTKGVVAASSDLQLHQNINNGSTPPHVPSIVSQSLLVSNLPNPSVCHLPRSIMDPRLAKLHQTGRAGLPIKHSGIKPGPILQQIAVPQMSCSAVSNGSGGSVFSVSNLTSKLTEDFITDPRLNETTSCNSSAVHQENIQRLDNTSEKRKTSQLNRNMNMEYSSPLNLYNDQSASNSGTNSYNRRLNLRKAAQTLTTSSEKANIKPSVSTFSDHRTQVLLDGSPARTESPSCSSVIFVPEDHLSPEGSGQHASLKEVFKTFDPTVSPFC